MRVSLIIPIYNSEKYIKNAVESVLQQPIKDIEIILVNDGSTDQSDKICKEYAEHHDNVKYIEQTNMGVSIARNVGMSNANGEYVMFLDADDRLVPDSLNVQIEKMLMDKPDVVMCSSYTSNMGRNRYGIDLQVKDAIVPGNQIFPLAGTFGACIYKLQLLRDYNISFDEGVGLAEDQVFKLKALYAASRIRTSSQFMYIYCDTPGSIMHTKNKGFDRVVAWQRTKEWFLLHGKKEHLPQLMVYVDMKITSRMLLYARSYVQTGHGKKELYEELKRVDGYDMLMQASENQVMYYQKKELYLFQHKPDKFVRTAYMQEMKITLGRIALKFPPIQKCRDKRKYPILTI